MRMRKHFEIVLHCTYMRGTVCSRSSARELCGKDFALCLASSSSVLWKQVITLQAHVANLAFLQASMKSYFEYPALFSPCAAATRPTVLATTPPAALGLPPAVLPPGGGGDLWSRACL